MADKQPYPVELRIEEVRMAIGKIVAESGLSISIIAMLLREMANKATDEERAHLNHLIRQQQQAAAEEGAAVDGPGDGDKVSGE